ncbi:MAG: phosphate signaling complex protein PhoU [Planctomycetes bacterium]|nr:phosphate signaling complex protein PhoU [Planctomycetota bacterium]
MSKHLQHDLDRLKKETLAMGSMVEHAINKAIRALLDRDAELAREVSQGDDAIDRKELEVEDMCLKILALHQPVAGDLRYLVAVLKVNNDLERMGDLAGNIAERAMFLASQAPLAIELEIERMVESVRTMVSESLDALVEQDPVLARRVCREDDAVDAMQRRMFDTLTALMMRDPSTVERAVQLLSVTRHLERIADSATNIAEDVVFVVEGEVIRHAPHPERARGSVR